MNVNGVCESSSRAILLPWLISLTLHGTGGMCCVMSAVIRSGAHGRNRASAADGQCPVPLSRPWLGGTPGAQPLVNKALGTTLRRHFQVHDHQISALCIAGRRGQTADRYLPHPLPEHGGYEGPALPSAGAQHQLAVLDNGKKHCDNYSTQPNPQRSYFARNPARLQTMFYGGLRGSCSSQSTRQGATGR